MANQRFIAEVLDLFDDVQRENQHLAHQIRLPVVVAAGDQSSGKSSLLSRLSGIADLPVGGQTTVTKCAIQLAMRQSPDVSCFRQDEKKDLGDPRRIKQEIEEFNASADKLRLDAKIEFRVEHPDAKNLTILDLTGIIHTAQMGEDDGIIDQVKALTEKSIKSENTIILCVVSSSSDLATNAIFTMLHKVDPDGDRTIVVFTKLDRLSDSSFDTFWDQVEKKKYHSFKNIHFVRCDTDPQEEKEFLASFFSNKFNESFEEDCTVENLQKKIEGILLEKTRAVLTDSWDAIKEEQENIEQKKAELDLLDTEEPVKIADDKLKLFIEESRNILKGSLEKINNGNEAVFSVYRKYFETFNNDYNNLMSEKVSCTFYRGQELLDFSNWISFRASVRPIITSFDEPARQCAEKVKTINCKIIRNLVDEIFGHDVAIEQRKFLKNRIDKIFAQQNKVLKERLDNIREAEEYLYMDDKLYLSELQKKESQKSEETESQGDQGGSSSTLLKAAETGAELAAALSPNPMVKLLPEVFKIGMKSITNEGKSLKTEEIAVASDVEETYKVALDVMINLAKQRMAQTIPSTILLCLNEKVQKEIIAIDRDHEAFLKLPCHESKEKKRFNELENQLHKIQEWNKKRDEIETKNKRRKKSK